MNLILDAVFYKLVCCTQHPAQFILDALHTQVVVAQSVSLKKGISHDPQHLSC